ncbi:MAG: hypothetical protein EOP10_32170, partial [Proteobacteria bacterium]
MTNGLEWRRLDSWRCTGRCENLKEVGNRYSYKIWVPRESLFDAISKLSRFFRSEDLEYFEDFNDLIWPDGRRIDQSHLEKSDSRDLVPVDSTYSGLFSVDFNFEPDDELRKYDVERQGYWRQEGDPVDSVFQDGRYTIKNIQLNIDLDPYEFRWFGSSPLFVCLDFEAVVRDMSDLFHTSPSVRR